MQVTSQHTFSAHECFDHFNPTNTQISLNCTWCPSFNLCWQQGPCTSKTIKFHDLSLTNSGAQLTTHKTWKWKIMQMYIDQCIYMHLMIEITFHNFCIFFSQNSMPIQTWKIKASFQTFSMPWESCHEKYVVTSHPFSKLDRVSYSVAHLTNLYTQIQITKQQCYSKKYEENSVSFFDPWTYGAAILLVMYGGELLYLCIGAIIQPILSVLHVLPCSKINMFA